MRIIRSMPTNPLRSVCSNKLTDDTKTGKNNPFVFYEHYQEPSILSTNNINPPGRPSQTPKYTQTQKIRQKAYSKTKLSHKYSFQPSNTIPKHAPAPAPHHAVVEFGHLGRRADLVSACPAWQVRARVDSA